MIGHSCHAPTQEYLKAVLEISESCYGQHLAWVQQAKIPEGDRAIYEDEVLSKVVDMAVKFWWPEYCQLSMLRDDLPS